MRPQNALRRISNAHPFSFDASMADATVFSFDTSMASLRFSPFSPFVLLSRLS